MYRDVRRSQGAEKATGYARLGDEVRALTTCARLLEDFWTPGIEGAPGGDKADVANKLRSIGAAARRRQA